MSRALVTTSGGLNTVAAYLGAATNDAAPNSASYIVIGSGMAPPDPNNSWVPGFEIFRAPITHRVRHPEGGITFHAYLDIDDQLAMPNGIAGMSVSAYGVVAGRTPGDPNDATLTSGTGIMIATANAPVVYSKNATITVSPDFTMLLSGTQGGQGLVLTSGGKALIADYLASPKATDGPEPPSYVTFGTVGVSGGYFATAVPGWEIYRAPVINRVIRHTAVPQVIWSFLVPSGDMAGLTLRTMGLMAGNATAASGTGTLMGVGYFPSPVVKTAFMLVSGNLAFTVSGTMV